MTGGAVRLIVTGLVCTFLTATPRSACAQNPGGQTISDVLSFLLTNRSVSTGNFVQDAEAGVATRDTISRFLIAELGSLPISASAGGFAYRLNPDLGVSIRSSESFGPFFAERSLTTGRHGLSFAVGYQQAVFAEIDGRHLRDGSLVAIGARLANETQPFDVETLTLRLRTDTLTLSGNYGVSDRLDVGIAMPLIRLTLSGTRVDTYRGASLIQAIASGNSTGPGDLIARAKYNVVRNGSSGIAIGADARLPTGDEQNLLGTGHATITPRFITSWEANRIGIHGNVGSTFGGVSNEVGYAAAITFVAAPRVTIVAEAAGRRLASIGRLVEVEAPHPQLVNVETIRLSGTDEATNRLVAIGGLKWNVASSLLLNLNVLVPLSRAGLSTNWTPTLTLDYSFGR
jgi:hypothetical protein